MYRLNLEQGRFLSPLTTKSRYTNNYTAVIIGASQLIIINNNNLFFSSGSNVCAICDEHQLLALGTEDGLVECFDPRSNTCVGVLDVSGNEGGGSVGLVHCGMRDE